MVGAAVAYEIPGRFHKGVHGIGLPFRPARASRTGGVHEGLRLRDGRYPRARELDILGQENGQVFHPDRDSTALFAVYHRDGRPPVALAGDAPVTQLEVHRGLAPSHGLQVFSDPFHGVGVLQAVELFRVDEGALALVGAIHGFRREIPALGLDDHDDGEPVLSGELEVALVMRRHRHDRPCTVVVEHEIGDIDRHPETGEGIDAASTGECTLFLIGVRCAGDLVLFQGLVHEGLYRSLLAGSLRQGLDEGMLRGDAHEGGAVEGVGPGGEDLYVLVGPFYPEADQRARAPADPVALHDEHALRPPFSQTLDVVQELLGILGDPEEPLVVLAQEDLGPAAPALSVLHLLVGEHGLAAVAPVQKGPVLVHEALLVHPNEEELFPPVIIRVAGGELATPVITETHAFELGLHVLHILVGPFLRVHAARDGRVLGGHAEGVPAHGMEHVESFHLLVASHDIADGVVSHMAHVDPPGRIGKHLEEIVLLSPRVDVHLEKPGVLPDLLPLGLYRLRVVVARHASAS
ncbi:MAG: hypothetical protein BWX71_02149 [Deltaproteobacteria bacterium ADurb.Bin072]|nr:MAG: hypothetical protein BWX71_02149 [Deltaproteobacteria bacterium ADurb.Bin072]